MTVEVCANSLESAINAETAGADRIELCTELGVGGLTPSYGLIKEARKRLNIPIHVLIRPRSGDFTYSADEFGIMKQDIAVCGDLGVDGIVCGVLHADGTLDEERTKELLECTGELRFTFHRAFDWAKDALNTAMLLEQMGADHILTSGQQTSAVAGLPLLTQLQKQLTRCALIPAGGIRPENAYQFKEKGFQNLHLSAVRFRQTLADMPAIPMNSPSFLQEGQIGISDPQVIQKVLEIVK
ncbi:copper homeostasis protein CutC [Poritiphilus flavus]|uniref:PF03932 family protein CutC n=1 Tax=Poritiphilus flavus TaxID=2697053 RepID=A0A6L9E708_9FLAO|nr:copper homeostasis protein CutC [Poritiphilus flavus]NAS10372.1 copper homeostasis protein CutC [Poritiphilus flavus]